MTSNQENQHVPVSELTSRYREAALRSADMSDPTEQNSWADKLHETYRKLASTDGGRQAIIELIDDVDPYIAGWAAAHSLQWVPDRARCVLERIRDGGGPGSMSAKWTLKEYEAGTLSFDY